MVLENTNLNLLKGVNIEHNNNILIIKEIELITLQDDENGLIEKANIYFNGIEDSISLTNKDKLEESEFNKKIEDWIKTNKI